VAEGQRGHFRLPGVNVQFGTRYGFGRRRGKDQEKTVQKKNEWRDEDLALVPPGGSRQEARQERGPKTEKKSNREVRRLELNAKKVLPMVQVRPRQDSGVHREKDKSGGQTSLGPGDGSARKV